MIESMNRYWDLLPPSSPCIGCISPNCATCDFADIETVACRQESKACVKTPSKAAVSIGEKEILTRKRRFWDSFESAGKVRLPVELFGRMTDHVILRADGDGMRDAGIRTGDILVFDKSRTPESGDIVVASVDGMEMCRRYLPEGDHVRIRREDGSTPDVITKDCVVFGVLTSITRVLKKTDVG